MTRLGVALGARAETFMGLSGLGDLVLTATGDLSRNRQVGLLLAQGQSLAAGGRVAGPRGRGRVLRAHRGEPRRGTWAWTCRSRRRWWRCSTASSSRREAVAELMGRGPAAEAA